MSGAAGGKRIQKADVGRTFTSYVEGVLKKIPGYKRASLSGSVKLGTKADYGDLDIVVYFEGTDKKEVKQRIIDVVTKLPNNVIVPFKSEKYAGRKYYNSGEIITVLYPIQGKAGEFIQIDNIIAISEEEHTFKNNFLDFPAEKQGLILGLTKVILLEEDPQEVFNRLGIKNIPSLEEDEELEFNLSSMKLTLRKVKLADFKEISREEIWSSTDWNAVRKLLIHYKLDGTFQELLDDVASKLKNSRSRTRVAGVFRSMVSVKSGKAGTPKGDNKEKALGQVTHTLAEELQDGSKIVALYAGGFKPPHKAHFLNAVHLSKGTDKLIIFIGPKVREGLEINADQSRRIWQIYGKYIGTPVEVFISRVSPVKDLYDWISLNQGDVDQIITGAMKDEMGRFSSMFKDPKNYSKVKLIELPMIESEENSKLSASDIRNSEKYLKSGRWIPSNLSREDMQKVLEVVTENLKDHLQREMLSDLDKVLEEFFEGEEEETDENVSGIPAAYKSILKSEDRDKLQDLYMELREKYKDTDFKVEYNNTSIEIKMKTDREVEDPGFDYTPYMASLLEYMIKEGVNITPLPEIKIKKDPVEGDSFFIDTAHYDPDTRELIVYAGGRHPKDVMRSFAHEMIHHEQNLKNKLNDVRTTDTTEDFNLSSLEEEAYSRGNIMFRGWEDYKKKETKNENVITEGRYDKTVTSLSGEVLRAWKEQVKEKARGRISFETKVDTKDLHFRLKAALLLRPGLDKLEVDGDSGTTSDKKDSIRILFQIDPSMLPRFWEEISMNLKDVIRHEIEHLTHSKETRSSVKGKELPDDSAYRVLIDMGLLRPASYFELQKEIDANLQDMYYRAKKERRPFKDVINAYLDYFLNKGEMTPEEKEDILKLWRKRIPALGLKVSL